MSESPYPSNHTIAPPDTPQYRSPDTGAVLKTIANPAPHLQTQQEHCLQLPVLCPASKNPGAGSWLKIRYAAPAYFLEVFSLSAYIQSFIAHPLVRDVEAFTQTLARDMHQLLGQGPLQVEAHFELPALQQSVTTTVVLK